MLKSGTFSGTALTGDRSSYLGTVPENRGRLVSITSLFIWISTLCLAFIISWALGLSAMRQRDTLLFSVRKYVLLCVLVDMSEGQPLKPLPAKIHFSWVTLVRSVTIGRWGRGGPGTGISFSLSDRCARLRHHGRSCNTIDPNAFPTAWTAQRYK